MDPNEQMEKLTKYLNAALKEYSSRGRDYAEAYKNYRVAVAKELLELRDAGMPVTIAYDIARGNDYVADLKQKEIIAESLYNSCKEAINTYKLQIKILQEQINKEYGNG